MQQTYPLPTTAGAGQLPAMRRGSPASRVMPAGIPRRLATELLAGLAIKAKQAG
jgi:hypothetical protein